MPDDLAALVRNPREVQIGFRLSAGDATKLRKLATKAGVGHTTLARLIVERYLLDAADGSPKE